MGNKTPSSRRKAGREAYSPEVDPMYVQPYSLDSWAHKMYLPDWLDGWNEAANEHALLEKLKNICPSCGQELKEEE